MTLSFNIKAYFVMFLLLALPLCGLIIFVNSVMTKKIIYSELQIKMDGKKIILNEIPRQVIVNRF